MSTSSRLGVVVKRWWRGLHTILGVYYWYIRAVHVAFKIGQSHCWIPICGGWRCSFYQYIVVGDSRASVHPFLGSLSALRLRHLDFSVQGHLLPRERGVRDAIARISFESPNGTFQCTATLMSSGTSEEGGGRPVPYMLTANRCVGSEEVANTLEARWHYRSTICAGHSWDPRLTTTRGG